MGENVTGERSEGEKRERKQAGWRARDGEVVNRSTVVSELEDVVWSVPYVRCRSLTALVNGQSHWSVSVVSLSDQSH